MRTDSTLQQNSAKVCNKTINVDYPRTLPPTIFCTIGFAKMGRIKLRLLSVEMGTSV